MFRFLTVVLAVIMTVSGLFVPLTPNLVSAVSAQEFEIPLFASEEEEASTEEGAADGFATELKADEDHVPPTLETVSSQGAMEEEKAPLTASSSLFWRDSFDRPLCHRFRLGSSSTQKMGAASGNSRNWELAMSLWKRDTFVMFPTPRDVDALGLHAPLETEHVELAWEHLLSQSPSGFSAVLIRSSQEYRHLYGGGTLMAGFRFGKIFSGGRKSVEIETTPLQSGAMDMELPGGLGFIYRQLLSPSNLQLEIALRGWNGARGDFIFYKQLATVSLRWRRGHWDATFYGGTKEVGIDWAYEVELWDQYPLPEDSGNFIGFSIGYSF